MATTTKSNDELYTIAVDVLARYDLTDPKIKSFISNIVERFDLPTLKRKASPRSTRTSVSEKETNLLLSGENQPDIGTRQLVEVLRSVKKSLDSKQIKDTADSFETKLPFFKKLFVEVLRNTNRDKSTFDPNNKTVIESIIERVELGTKQKANKIPNTIVTAKPMRPIDDPSTLSEPEKIDDKSQQLKFFNTEANTALTEPEKIDDKSQQLKFFNDQKSLTTVDDFTSTGSSKLKNIISDALDSSNALNKFILSAASSSEDIQSMLKKMGDTPGGGGGGGGGGFLRTLLGGALGATTAPLIRKYASKILPKWLSKRMPGIGAEGAEAAGKTVLTEGAEAAGKTVLTEGAEAAGKTVLTEGAEAAGKTVLTEGAEAAGKATLLKTAAKYVKLPVIGPLLGLGIDLATGESLGRAVTGAVGAELGGLGAGTLGAAAGLGVGSVPLALAANVTGQIGGNLAGKALYDSIFGTTEGDSITPPASLYPDNNTSSLPPTNSNLTPPVQQPQPPPTASTQQAQASTTLSQTRSINQPSPSSPASISIQGPEQRPSPTLPPLDIEGYTTSSKIPPTDTESGTPTIRIIKPNPNTPAPLPPTTPPLEQLPPTTPLLEPLPSAPAPSLTSTNTQTTQSDVTKPVDTQIFNTIAKNTEKTSNSIEFLAQALTKIANVLINNQQNSQSSQPTINLTPPQEPSAPPAAQVAASNVDPIRATRLKFIA